MVITKVSPITFSCEHCRDIHTTRKQTRIRTYLCHFLLRLGRLQSLLERAVDIKRWFVIIAVGSHCSDCEYRCLDC